MAEKASPLFSFDMGTIFDVQKSLNALVNGFEQEVINEAIRADLPEIIREQLYAGKNGRGKNLRPTYDNDPFFKSAEAGPWRNRAQAYKNWKMKVQPPKVGSFLGFAPRGAETPNLIIRGDFHDSIFAVKTVNGISIGSDGFAQSGDIERKYGHVIYGFSPQAKRYLVEYRLKPAVNVYFRKCGLILK